MSRIRLFLLLPVLMALSFCVISLNDYADLYYADLKVVLEVTPDDAKVFLDDKFIGYCHEFDNERDALRLKSRDVFLTISREGYLEEEIDVSRISKNKIVIKLDLREDPYGKSPRSRSTAPAASDLKPEEPPPAASAPLETEKLSELSLTISEPESAIWIDGRFWGVSLEKEPAAIFLKPGRHTVEIFKPGFKKFFQEISIEKEKFLLNVALEKIK